MNENPFESLGRIYHEPNRLAILSLLSASNEPVRFTELKEMLNLTDGNLSRHIKTLEEAGVINVQKQFIDSKPCTTIKLSGKGKNEFSKYLSNLENVFKIASSSVKQKKSQSSLKNFWNKLIQT